MCRCVEFPWLVFAADKRSRSVEHSFRRNGPNALATVPFPAKTRVARCLRANGNSAIVTWSATRSRGRAENTDCWYAQRRCDVHQSCIARHKQITATEHRHRLAKVPFASAFE